MTMTYKQVRRYWHELHTDEELRKKLNPEIWNSWERSYHYKISNNMRENPYICTKLELTTAQENSKNLIDTSLPVMNSLLEFVAGTGFVISLTDSNLCALKVMGDKEPMMWANHAHLIEGSLWSEELVGTNAGSLALSLAKPVSVYGYEHFCLFSIASAASFAPIIDQGNIIGCLGMIAPFDKVSHHTLGMVVAAAKHIQSTMCLERITKYHQVVMDSMFDGVMVVNIDGNITYMNRKCARILGLQIEKTIGSSIYDLLGNPAKNQYFINIVTQGRTITDESILITTNDKTKTRCNVTCNPLHSSDPNEAGNVIILRESQRINHLVGNWIGRNAKTTFEDIIGDNPRFQQVINASKTSASSDSNVLILGESGTGKDIMAQAIHNASPRRNNPFLAINCAALPRELIASELFGYEEGAFTGAKKGGNIGKFELADQGTIFLDEIGDLPLDLQATLLRVIEEKNVIHLGGSKLIPVNVRIIAATNKDLEEEVSRNRFRADLFYRLGVIRLIIPPLRERPDDILQLTHHFIKIICQRYNKPLKKLSPHTIDAFLNYNWPGNVRELQNILEGAIQLVKGDEISYDCVREYLLPKDHLSWQLTKTKQETRHLTLSDIEKQTIEEYLKKYNYNKDKTAKALGISRRTLYRRLEQYNIK